MFKFPSAKEIFQSAKDTFRRFPVAISLMITLVVYSIFLIHTGLELDNERFFMLIHVLILGSIWAIGLTFFNEVTERSKKFKIFSNIILLFLLVGYLFLYNDFETDKFIYKILIVTGVFIFVALFLPFYTKNKQLDYWNFNKEIFQRLTLTTLYSIVIYAGIAIALGIMNLLFQLDIDERVFLDTLIIIVGIFSFWMFLSGIPKKFEIDKISEYEYPKSLKIFVQFILLPLTTLYLAILYVYSAKILFTWELPQGAVSYLVLIFSALGIFSLMLIYPIQKDDNNKWIKTYAKSMYWAILPLIVLLFVAILKRIIEYGFTENRFYVVVLAIWLACLSIYMLLTTQKNIKIITISFSVVFFLASFGPWSAFNISKISQSNKLNDLLIENGIFVDEGYVTGVEVSDSIYSEIYDKTSYIINNHGTDFFEQKFNFEFENEDERWYATNTFLDSLELIIDYDYSATGDDNYFWYSYKPELLDIMNFDNLYVYEEYSGDTTNVEISDTTELTIIKDEQKIVFNIGNYQEEFTFKDYYKKLSGKYGNSYGEVVQDEDVLREFDLGNYHIKLIILSFEGNLYDGIFSTTWFKTYILIKNID